MRGRRYPGVISTALYICYLSLDDPLVHTQVLAYLRGLADAGHQIHLLTFETGSLVWRRRQELRRTLAAAGIRWHGLRYHKRPSLPATIYDVIAGALYATAIVLRHDVDALHARSHVPAAMALIAGRLARRKPALIFDIRGLMAEEYVDAGRWREGGVPFRITKAVEQAAIARANAIVVLTERVRRQLFGQAPPPSVFVIPCCADLEALALAQGGRARARAKLGLGEGPVMVYVGKFGGWYMAPEMAEFFAVARSRDPRLHFLILTRIRPRGGPPRARPQRLRGPIHDRVRAPRADWRVPSGGGPRHQLHPPGTFQGVLVSHQDRRIPRRGAAGRIDCRDRGRRGADHARGRGARRRSLPSGLPVSLGADARAAGRRVCPGALSRGRQGTAVAERNRGPSVP